MTGGGLPTRAEIEILRNAVGEGPLALKREHLLKCPAFASHESILHAAERYLALVDGIAALAEDLERHGWRVGVEHTLRGLLVEAAPPQDRLTLEERDVVGLAGRLKYASTVRATVMALVEIIARLAPKPKEKPDA